MIIEVAHRFNATHQHQVPPGRMSDSHEHSWVWTVRLEGGLESPYGWVADFDAVDGLMGKCTREHYVGTTEQILVGLVNELTWLMEPGKVVVVWARLEEKPGRAAIYLPEAAG